MILIMMIMLYPLWLDDAPCTIALLHSAESTGMRRACCVCVQVSATPQVREPKKFFNPPHQNPWTQQIKTIYPHQKCDSTLYPA
mmetsp:Transcript_28841/g.56056  ORF Transcript_28841/g.56056 Transcript_28841/m.56056 type:complete len:84 (-) Transcript_28841:614-865(-)